MSNDTDDDQMVYAMNHAAVLITHDKEFTRRRKRFTIGQHVRLCCEQPDGPNLLRTHIDELVPMLLALPHVVIEVAPHGCDLTIGWG